MHVAEIKESGFDLVTGVTDFIQQAGVLHRDYRLSDETFKPVGVMGYCRKCVGGSDRRPGY